MEGLLKEYPNTLILRVRMPIVADLTYPRNFITKIIKYEKVRCWWQHVKRCTWCHFLHLHTAPKDSLSQFCTLVTLLVLCSQIINIPNSMTVLPELLPYSIEMVRMLFRGVTIAKSSRSYFISIRCHELHTGVFVSLLCCSSAHDMGHSWSPSTPPPSPCQVLSVAHRRAALTSLTGAVCSRGGS